MSLLGAEIVRFALEVIQLTEQLERFFGQGALVVEPQIAEFPSRMREAAHLGDALSK